MQFLNASRNFLHVQDQTLAPLRQYCDDMYAGEVAIRDKPEIYLPRLESELGDTEIAKRRYKDRLQLAFFDAVFTDHVDQAIGIMQKNEPIIQLDPEIEWQNALRYDSTIYKDGLTSLKARMNKYQLIHGKYGLLLDYALNSRTNEYNFIIKEYQFDRIIGSYSGDSVTPPFVVIDDTDYVYTKNGYELIEKWRVLSLLPSTGYFYTAAIRPDAWNMFDLTNPESTATITIHQYDGATLPFIPFVIANASGLGYSVFDRPPLLNIAYANQKLYESDSLYRRCMKHASEITLVALDADMPEKVTLGGFININTAGNAEHRADFKFLEPTCSGLSEMRIAKDSIKLTIQEKGMKHHMDSAGANASGEALRLRSSIVASQLAMIDHVGGTALDELLYMAALIKKMSPEQAMQSVGLKVDTTYMQSDRLMDASTVNNILTQNQVDPAIRQEVMADMTQLESLQ